MELNRESVETIVKQVMVTRAGMQQEHPNITASRFLADHQIIATRAGIYRFNEKWWHEISDAEMLARLIHYDQESSGPSSHRRRNEELSFIKAVKYEPVVHWNNIAESEVPFENGVLSLTTAKIRQHDPSDYLENVIPHEYSHGVTSTLWERCLDDYFGSDEDGKQKIAALQEFFGYVLLPHARYKKALMLYSHSGDTGKSTIKEMLEYLVGASGACHIGLDTMGDRFALAPIIGKRLNSVSEQSVNVRIADGKFKELVGTQEPVQIERKGKDPFEYTPIAKHVICTNNLPRIDDTTNAVYNRLLVIELTRVVTKKDTQIWNKLKAEFPGILAWAVEGAKRLNAAGGEFTKVDSSEKLIGRYKSSQSPIGQFMTEKCVRKPDAERITPKWRIPTSEALDRYREYERNDRITSRDFTAGLRPIGVQVEELGLCYDGKRTRCITGYRWKTPEEIKREEELARQAEADQPDLPGVRR
jgi:putative DNA primase/helicase